MKRLALAVAIAMVFCGVVRATEMGVVAEISQCFADNEVLRAEVERLQEELKSYQQIQSEEPVIQ